MKKIQQQILTVKADKNIVIVVCPLKSLPMYSSLPVMSGKVLKVYFIQRRTATEATPMSWSWEILELNCWMEMLKLYLPILRLFWVKKEDN